MTTTTIECLFSALTEVQGPWDLSIYNDFVRPLDYDFSLSKGARYHLLGVLSRAGTPWLYVTQVGRKIDVSIVPAVLFELNGVTLPLEMKARLTGDSRPDLQIVLAPLSGIENWYERYIDDDPLILKTIKSLVESQH